MSRHTRAGHRTATSVVGLLTLAGITVGMAALRGDDRDEAAFREYVQTYVGGFTDSSDPGLPGRDRGWTRQHPELIMQEGDRACAWLSSRPVAPDLAPDESWTSGGVQSEYQRTAVFPRGLSVGGWNYVVAGAWAHLCGDEREKRTSPTRAQLED